ncbi:MAG: RNA methyltransferase [Gammaproteobacteria bacterium]|nr:RNA methyltransferase [Gammaproteobacteria bacterium]
MLDRIHIILVGTTHPGNIGAAARAMKTMGLSHLMLVRPKVLPNAESFAMSSGADDILQYARVCETLDEAVAECVWVAGTSARSRTIDWPTVTPRQCAGQLVAEARGAAPVALVFGCEHSGLSNDELGRCHVHVRIPTRDDFSSLNIAAAVQVMAYEVFVASSVDAEELPLSEVAGEYATAGEMELFYCHLEQVLVELDFLDLQQPRNLMHRLRRLYGRVRPDKNEINILRGILGAMSAAGAGRNHWRRDA